MNVGEGGKNWLRRLMLVERWEGRWMCGFGCGSMGDGLGIGRLGTFFEGLRIP